MNYTIEYRHDDEDDGSDSESFPLPFNSCRCTHSASLKISHQEPVGPASIRLIGNVTNECERLNINGGEGDDYCYSECSGADKCSGEYECKADATNGCEMTSMVSGEGDAADAIHRVESYATSLTEPSSSQTDSFVTVINKSAAATGNEAATTDVSCRTDSAGNLDSPARLCDVELTTSESAELDHLELGPSTMCDTNCELYRDGVPSLTTVTPALCPSGLECLLDAGQLVVHMGNLRHDYIFNVRCEKRMEVINELRRVLFYAEEEPPQLEDGSFLFKIYGRNKEEVAQAFCPASHTCLLCGINWHWFKSCQFQTVVYFPPGVIAGFVRRVHTCLVQEFQILNSREEIILRLRGAPTDLEIYSLDLEHGIGRLSVHGWVGVMHEVRRTANDYGLTFPVDLDVRVKGLLLAAVFTIDWLYRTSGGRR